MLKARIVRIGNSQGIRIPKALLEQTGLAGQVELLVEGEWLTSRGELSSRPEKRATALGEQAETYQADGEAPGALASVRGVYRPGRIDLAEQPEEMPDETHVIVTFLEHRPVDLRKRGIDEAAVAELRSQLASFAEDWDSPEMSIYDHYDAAKAAL